MNTKNCIICNKPAKTWTGHIHTEMGTISSGWCDNHRTSIKPRSNRCTSINPNSCGGEYKLSEIELIEELTEQNLSQYRKQQEFSEMIDRQCSPHHPINKRKSFWDFLLKI